MVRVERQRGIAVNDACPDKCRWDSSVSLAL